MSRLKQIARLFSGYPSKKSQDNDFQCQAIIFIASIATPTAAIFAIINFSSGRIGLALVEVFTFCILLPCFKVNQYRQFLPYFRNIIMITASIMFLAVFIDGGIARFGIIWSLVVPFLAFLLMGQAKAWYWVSFYACIIALLTFMHFDGDMTLPYSNAVLSYFPGVFIFFSLIAAAFQLELEHLHIRHHEMVDELEELQEGLEERVSTKTSELTKTNQQLEEEIEDHKNTAKALKESEEMFLHAQKMEALGVLVGGIAHDFNNILASISCNAHLLSIKLTDDPELTQRVYMIDQARIQAADTISQLLSFARKQQVELHNVPLATFMKEALKLAVVSIPENIRVKQDICSDELVIQGDLTQLQQMILNLTNNACHALEGSSAPEISISLDAYTPDAAFKQKYAHLDLAEQYAHLSVQDNGMGISSEDQQRIFDPFFTTKEQGKGTGLGLAMVFGSIQTHGGIIHVDSTPDCGSTFHVYFPLQQRPDDHAALPLSRGTFRGHGEMILFADDGEPVREAMGKVLESMGYRVMLASNGEEAVALFEQHQDDIALCILDLVMPEMGGREAAEKIRQLNPSAAILFATGYDKLKDSADLNEASSEPTLRKPFDINELNRTIHQLLNP